MIYGDATGFAAYWAARGVELPGTLDDDAIDAALLVASEWIDGVYGPSFVGHKTSGFLQEREWPRTSAVVQASGQWGEYHTFATDAIPDRVKNAAYEAAYRHVITPGSLQVDYTPAKYKSVSVEGAISVDYAMFSNASEVQIQISAIDKLLWPLLDQNAIGSVSGLSGPSSRL